MRDLPAYGRISNIRHLAFAAGCFFITLRGIIAPFRVIPGCIFAEKSTDMKKTKTSRTPSRISKAAVGKILANIVASSQSSGMDAAAFRILMIAACEYMHSGKTAMRNLPKEWAEVKDSIDKAVLRSAKARERAARRKGKSTKGTKSWSPSDVHVPSRSLEEIRRDIHRQAKKAGKNVECLDRIRQSWEMEDLLSQKSAPSFSLRVKFIPPSFAARNSRSPHHTAMPCSYR